VSFALGTIELQSAKIGLPHPVRTDAVEDGEPRVVSDLQTKPQRSLDQVRLFTSEQLLAESAQLRVESSDTFEKLTTKGHVRSPHLRLCFHREGEQAARFALHDREAIAQIPAVG